MTREAGVDWGMEEKQRRALQARSRSVFTDHAQSDPRPARVGLAFRRSLPNRSKPAMQAHHLPPLGFVALLGAAAYPLRPEPAPAAPSPPSSHREAPFVTEHPKVDATDFYMFRSYESGRGAFVTVIANYQPLQSPYGGPNYFFMDPEALYEIHLDTNGDAVEDLTFQFRFQNQFQQAALSIGPAGNQKSVPVPLLAVGPVGSATDPNLNLRESYSLTVVSGDRRTGAAAAVSNADDGSTVFTKPLDNAGNKTIADYAAYAAQF